MGGGINEWQCGPASTDGIGTQYLPSTCRGVQQPHRGAGHPGRQADVIPGPSIALNRRAALSWWLQWVL